MEEEQRQQQRQRGPMHILFCMVIEGKNRIKKALNKTHKSRKFIIIAIITSNTRAFAYIAA